MRSLRRAVQILLPGVGTPLLRGRDFEARVFKAAEGNSLPFPFLSPETVEVVDTWTPFAGERGDARPEEFPDRLHPKEAGYRKWASALRPEFGQRGWLR